MKTKNLIIVLFLLSVVAVVFEVPALLANYGSRGRYVNYLEVSVTVDPADLADGVGTTIASISVPGAALGDYVIVAAPYDLQDLIVVPYVQAANVVEIRIQNENAGSNVNLTSGTWKVRVFR